MNKKLPVLILSIFVALGFAVTAQAQVSVGVLIQPYSDAGSHPCTDPLVTNQIFTVTVFASNSSFNGNPSNPANLIPVYLEGTVTENDACSSSGCPAGTEVPGAIGFLGCTPLDECISNCQETAPGTGIVTFDIAPNCLLLGAGQQFKPLVLIDKQALIPTLAGTVDCTLPSDYGKYNIAAKCLDNIATQGVECQARDPLTGQTGFSSCNSEIYFPPAPCIDVTKHCEPETACIGTPITFSGTVTNCGDVDLINLNVADNKGNITGGTCSSILPVGQSCTYAGHYTSPIVIGDNTDTVTVTGETTQGVQVSGQASDTCVKDACDEIPTVITLSSFTATPKAGKVVLKWSTEAEVENAGFNIYRSETEDGEYTKINDSLIPAQGSSTQGASYEFFDKDAKNRKTYYYKLEDIDLNGTATMHEAVKATPRWIFRIFK